MQTADREGAEHPSAYSGQAQDMFYTLSVLCVRFPLYFGRLNSGKIRAEHPSIYSGQARRKKSKDDC
ncbi:MAG: hypothetical protein A2Y33_00855 [Spirochaetes bacterium GWF1_51_8]|nr:MAG: hypothetical protein A2Y33_00855 [Spirochaetes bacterium GWF1_51_8]